MPETGRKPHYHVSAGLIWKDGRLLISRRPKGVHLEGFWEFPGGKQEPGEDLRGCLAREIREELGVEARVEAPLLTVDHEYEGKRISLHVFNCAWVGGEPVAIACQEVRWVDWEGLSAFQFPPPDMKVIESLTKRRNRESGGYAMFYRKDDTGYRLLAEGVQLKTLVHGERTHLCEFRIAKGGRVPEHSHPHEQTGYLVSGRMRFIVRDEMFEAGPGDSWSIAGDVPHAAEVLEDSVMVEVFSPLRQDYLDKTSLP